MSKHSREPEDENRLASTAEEMVATLLKAVYRYKLFFWVLAIVVVALVGSGITQGIYIVKANNDESSIRQASLAQCLGGNMFRANDEKRWDSFFTLLIHASVNPGTIRSTLEKQIATLGLPSDEVQALDLIINTNWSPSTNANSIRLINQFEGFIAKTDAPQPCRARFSVSEK